MPKKRIQENLSEKQKNTNFKPHETVIIKTTNNYYKQKLIPETYQEMKQAYNANMTAFFAYCENLLFTIKKINSNIAECIKALKIVTNDQEKNEIRAKIILFEYSYYKIANENNIVAIKERFFPNKQIGNIFTNFDCKKQEKDILLQLDEIVQECKTPIITKVLRCYIVKTNKLCKQKDQLKKEIVNLKAEITKLRQKPWWHRAHNTLLRLITFNCASKTKYLGIKQLKSQIKTRNMEIAKIEDLIEQYAANITEQFFRSYFPYAFSNKVIMDINLDLWKIITPESDNITITDTAASVQATVKLANLEADYIKMLPTKMTLFAKRLNNLKTIVFKKDANNSDFDSVVKPKTNDLLLGSDKLSSSATLGC